MCAVKPLMLFTVNLIFNYEYVGSIHSIIINIPSFIITNIESVMYMNSICFLLIERNA